MGVFAAAGFFCQYIEPLKGFVSIGLGGLTTHQLCAGWLWLLDAQRFNQGSRI